MSSTNQTINPATGETIRTFDVMSDDHARELLQASHQAFTQWRERSLDARIGIIRRVGDLLRKREKALSQQMTQEMGKPIAQGADEVKLCAGICDYTADNAPQALADETRDLGGGRSLVTYQPAGVILGIQPWNFPLYQALRYSVACIAAGNTVLLKHAPNVWGSALALEQLFRDAGLPEHVFTVLLIDSDQVPALIEHEYVRGVTFTGSAAAGRKVAAKAGECLKKTVLELGSNDAHLVLEDADLDTALDSCSTGRIYNNGESCVAAKRFIVVDSIHDQFREALIERFRGIEYGDPDDLDTQLGPIARDDLRDALHDQVTRSVQQGASCALGGKLPEGRGYFYPATVLEDVEPGMPAYDEELFGPVVSLIRVADEAEAIRVANDSRYGLGGGIYSRGEDRAIRIARESFDTGMVMINGYRLAQPNLPFGGVKDSGYGREHGGFGMREFVNIKTVMIVEH